MSIRARLQKTLRRGGFFDSGRLLDLTADGGDVGTADRAFPRTAVPVAASDSSGIGDDNLFLVSQEHDLPAPAGLWPFIV